MKKKELLGYTFAIIVVTVSVINLVARIGEIVKQFKALSTSAEVAEEDVWGDED